MMQNDDVSHRRLEHRYWIATSVAGIFTAIIATIGVYLSLEALKATKQSVDALSHQNNVIEDQERKTLRAYLYVDNTTIHSEDEADKTKSVIMHIEIANGGTTPAYESKTWSTGQIAFYPMNEGVVNQFNNRIDEFKKYPGNEINNVPFKDYKISINIKFPTNMNNTVYRNLANQEAETIYFYGRTEFIDTFGNPHWHRFCFAVGSDFIRGNEKAYIERCPYLNDADYEKRPIDTAR